MKKLLVNVLVKLLGRTAAWRVGRSLYMRARGEAQGEMSTNGELDVLHNAIAALNGRDNLVFMDIGANVGDWTLAAGRFLGELESTPAARFFAFEPTPSTQQTLADRIKNEAPDLNVTIISAGVSSQCGTAEFHIVGDNAGTNSLHSHQGSSASHRIAVDLVTLDSFCRSNGIRQIDFVKIDTEGHDVEVLKGASTLFEQGSITVCQFEYNWLWVDSRHYLKDVFDMFAESSYVVGKIVPGGVEFYQSWHPELERYFATNFVLVKRDSCNSFSGSVVAFNNDNVAEPVC